jgi:hypothetical protein
MLDSKKSVGIQVAKLATISEKAKRKRAVVHMEFNVARNKTGTAELSLVCDGLPLAMSRGVFGGEHVRHLMALSGGLDNADAGDTTAVHSCLELEAGGGEALVDRRRGPGSIRRESFLN